MPIVPWLMPCLILSRILHTMAHDVYCTTLPRKIIYHCLLLSTFIMDLFKRHITPVHGVQYLVYIYIYAFSRRFYPKRLTLHSSYSFTFLSALAFPGNRTHDLGIASAMLYHLSYRKATGLALSQYCAYDWLYLIDNSQCKKRNGPKYICIFQNRSGTAHCLSLSHVNINCKII